MPNHITNKVSAPAHVLTSLINEDGRLDFGKIIKFEGEFPWDGVCGAAETAAEAAINLPLSNNPMLAGMQRHSRETYSVTKLSDESFEQFVQMLRNHRKTGYMHCMDFARHAWAPSGTPTTRRSMLRPAHYRSRRHGARRYLSSRLFLSCTRLKKSRLYSPTRTSAATAEL